MRYINQDKGQDKEYMCVSLGICVCVHVYPPIMGIIEYHV